VAKSREALEGAELEDFVEQERHWTIRSARGCEIGERVIERFARGPWTLGCGMWRDRRKEALRRARGALDVDVLARIAAQPLAQRMKRRRPAGPAAAEQHRDARGGRLERRENAPFETRMWSHHRRPSAIGILMLWSLAD
jgi:hypothetical protein